ncbi:hypothetical protein Tco_1002711 [Tanacetum coccineum]|uniref:Uncharacterized protein n=1 Tax=Tanacetum coccineum TaxID=301880 RepID=A0ABQ5F8H6_9ASTR
MEPDIKNMTMSEYLKYEAAKERKLWDDVRSRRNPTNYNEADVDSFYRNKSKTFSYPYSHNLTPPRTCFLPVQPYPKNYLESTNESNDADIENMTISEYNLYVSKQGLGMNQPRGSEEDGMMGDTFDMWDITVDGRYTGNMEMEPDIKNMTMSEYLEYEAAKERILWDDDSIWERDDDSEEDQEEDGNDGDTFDMWDITVEDVERIRKFFNVPDEIDEIVQPLIP